MKYIFYAVVVFGLIYAGIKHFAGSGPSKPVTETVGKLRQTQIKAMSAKHASDFIQVNRAVQNFRVTEGRLPKSLQELKDKGYVGKIPGGLSYDPATGDVSESP